MASKTYYLLWICILLISILTISQIVLYFSIEKPRLRQMFTDVGLIRIFSDKIRDQLERFHSNKNVSRIILDDNNRTLTNALPACPRSPPNLMGPLATYYNPPTFEKMEVELKHLRPGGHFVPKHCQTDQRVAIVIPYRNRTLQLRTILYNLHVMLERQQIEYGIFVIEQAGNTTFNRGLLLNIGYTEAIKSYNYTCFVFHDVDLIPQDDRIYYGCGQHPRHLSAAIDKFNYKLPYPSIAGGVTQLRRGDVNKINGYSNLYFGWGGEDDDLARRLRNASLKVERYSMAISRYRMIKHSRDKSNPDNPNRLNLLNHATSRIQSDGLTSLKYKVLNTTHGKLFTNVSVEVNRSDYNESKQ